MMIKLVRNKKAFSLIELVTVLILSTLIMGAMVKWVVSVGSVVSANLKVGPQNVATVAVDRMEDELRRAVSCSDRGYDSPLRQISNSPYLVSFISDTTSGGVPQQVWWRIYNGTLQRAAITSSGSCTFATPSTSDYVTQASSIDTANSWIQAVDPATGLNSATLYPTCALTTDVNCQLPALTIHLAFSTNAVATFNRSMPIGN